MITHARTAAKNLPLAVLSALAHARLEVTLGKTPAGEKWKAIMSTFVSYFPGRGTVRETAYLEGKASMILRALEKRGIAVPEETRERITSCTDLDTLTLWFDRSLTATAAEDLFAEDPQVPGTSSEQA